MKSDTAAYIVRPLLFSLVFATVGISQETRHPYRPGFDALHYEFTVGIPDTGSHVTASARILVRRYTSEPILRLDLVGLKVTAVRLGGRPAAFRQDEAGLSIPFPATHSLPETVLVELNYGGRVTDGLIMRKAGNRWTAFGDNWPNRARHWLPTIDHPSDKATVKWIVNAPAGRTVLANGRFVESTSVMDGPSSDRRLTVWESQRPIPTYVMVLAAAPLVSKRLRTGNAVSEFPGAISQTVHSAPEEQDYIPGPFERAVDIVEFFAGRIGPFPYEKLDHVQSSTLFGGMENASAIFYYDEGFKKREISTRLIAHETAHQWFGDAVTPLDWPHVWLSEGFATYWAELWIQYDEGDSAFRSSMRSMREQIIRSRVTSRKPVIDTAETNLMAFLNSNSYQKGAWILHMLRSTIGDTAFFRGMSQYYRRFRHQSALSSDFRSAMESSSGMELGWFFDQWLRRPGLIHATLRWNFDANDRSIRFRVMQDSTALPYRFTLRAMIDEPGGKSTATALDIPAKHETTVRISWTGSQPTGITFDPLVELLWRFAEE